MSDHWWWLLIRASGLVAWALLAWSMILGGLLAARVIHRPDSIRRAVGLHRHASALSLGLVVVHLVALIGDSYIDFRLLALFVPFVGSWRPGAVAWGIVAMYTAVIVEASSLLHARLSKRTWRLIHRLSALSFASATVHLLQAGSESSTLTVRWCVTTVVMILGFLYLGRPLGLFKRERVRTESVTPGSAVMTAAGSAIGTAITGPLPWRDGAPAQTVLDIAFSPNLAEAGGASNSDPVDMNDVADGLATSLIENATGAAGGVDVALPGQWVGQSNRAAW